MFQDQNGIQFRCFKLRNPENVSSPNWHPIHILYPLNAYKLRAWPLDTNPYVCFAFSGCRIIVSNDS